MTFTSPPPTMYSASGKTFANLSPLSGYNSPLFLSPKRNVPVKFGCGALIFTPGDEFAAYIDAFDAAAKADAEAAAKAAEAAAKAAAEAAAIFAFIKKRDNTKTLGELLSRNQ